MQKSDTLSGAAYAAVGIFFIIGALQLGVSSPTKDGVPGAGFFPLILGAVVALLGGILMMKSILYNGEKTASFALDSEQRANLRPFFATIAALVAMFALWRLVNFEVALCLFSLAINKVYGRGWLFSILFSVVFFLLVHLMFVRLCHIQFEI